jgi:hypothetical protein
MNRLIVIAAAAALVAGCGKEAERFGYRGADLDDDQMFFSTGPTVTNWVPMRVLSVIEDYPITEDEAALIKAAGIIEPSASFETIPEGYEKMSEEPWFVTWRKEAENFGIKGVNGFVSHYNEDKKVWETGETFFSSYYGDEASALVTLAKLKSEVSKRFSPKRFHEFKNCWIAEYLRMRVMCLVGQKPDGTWSCMLDIQDKNRPGCGQWEPPKAQAERLADYRYRKDLAAWKELSSKQIAGNHEAVEKIRAERGLELFGESNGRFSAAEGRTGYQRFGARPAGEVSSREDLWKERLGLLVKATGVELSGEPSVQDSPSGHSVWSVTGSNDIYEVRLDVAFPPEKAQEGETAAAEGEEPPPAPYAEWREVCVEKILPGFEVPPRPQPPAR